MGAVFPEREHSVLQFSWPFDTESSAKSCSQIRKCPNLAGPKPQNSFLLGACFEDTELSTFCPLTGHSSSVYAHSSLSGPNVQRPREQPLLPFSSLPPSLGDLLWSNSFKHHLMPATLKCISPVQNVLWNYQISTLVGCFFYFSLFFWKDKQNPCSSSSRPLCAVLPHTGNKHCSSRAPPQT